MELMEQLGPSLEKAGWTLCWDREPALAKGESFEIPGE